MTWCKSKLSWSSKGRQEIRFKNVDKLIFSGCSILDYGCGFADLNKYLKKNFLKKKLLIQVVI